MTSLAIHTDRLKKTLEKNGVSWKRHKILELLSSIFGYRNSNELTAAHKRGEIAPPKVVPVGEFSLPNGETIVVARDPIANASYAIDQAFLAQVVAEDRAETFGPTPYGHLVDLSRLLDAKLEKLEPTNAQTASGKSAEIDLFCALKSFRNGGEGITAYLSEDELYADCAYLCRNDWKRRSQMGGIPEGFNPETASDREVVEIYYSDANERESFEVHVVTLGLPAALAGATSPSGQQINPNATIKLKLYQAEISHKHGTDIYVEASQEALNGRIAKYCRDNWGEWLDFGEDDSDDVDPETLSDEDVTSRYFAAMETESCDESTTEVEVPVTSLDLTGVLSPNPSEKGRKGIRSPETSSKNAAKPGLGAKSPAPAPLPPGFKNYPFMIEQRDQILAALRLWQSMDKAQIPDEIRWIAEDDRDECLSDDDIDQICETLNHPGPARPEASTEIDPLQALINEHADGNSWGEHVDYPRADWRYEVDNNDTGLGYWEWVLHRLEDAEHHPLDPDEDRIANAQVRPHHALMTMLELGDGSERPLYLTNAMGEHAHGDPELMKKYGLRWSLDDDGYFYPLEGWEQRFISDAVIDIPNGFSFMLGYSALYKGQKYAMPAAEYYFGEDGDRDEALAMARAYADDIRTRVSKIGGFVFVDEDDGPDSDRHTIQVLVPFAHLFNATAGQKSGDPDQSWTLALIEFLLPSDAPRVEANFNPQAWVGRSAISVDPEGETSWDITAEIILMGEEAALQLKNDDYPTDHLRYSAKAPQWVQDWSGPFWIEVEDSIKEFFEHFEDDAND